MAGAEDADDLEKAREFECSFVWDDDSKLYFHASSGFYHDPTAGWYYSSKDGLYYTFENGNYVPLTSNKGEEPERQQSTGLFSNEPIEDNQDNEEHFTSDGLENQRPPSEWLEDTLIDLYLSGYSNLEADTENSTTFQVNEDGQSRVSNEIVLANHFTSDESAIQQVSQLEECAHEIMQDSEALTGISSDKDALQDEESWQAQYGQVVELEDECMAHFPVIDLWDWEIVVETVKRRNMVSRLLGRLVRRSSKLHPSVPSGGGRLKTASIHDVHLDLVRVASGKVYRLRIPNRRYLATLSKYDSSNPTKDWGFPDLFVNMHDTESVGCKQTCGINDFDAVTRENSSASPDVAIQKQSNQPYRDRAAERRNLHGEFSIGPGQKKFSGSNMFEEESTSKFSDPEEAAAEAMNMTFGKGSYARRVLEKMGWKDGEALGSTSKRLLEPLQAVGNKGYAGLGWNHIR